jgi:hypothetical protein
MLSSSLWQAHYENTYEFADIYIPRDRIAGRRRKKNTRWTNKFRVMEVVNSVYGLGVGTDLDSRQFRPTDATARVLFLIDDAEASLERPPKIGR